MAGEFRWKAAFLAGIRGKFDLFYGQRRPASSSDKEKSYFPMLCVLVWRRRAMMNEAW